MIQPQILMVFFQSIGVVLEGLSCDLLMETISLILAFIWDQRKQQERFETKECEAQFIE